MNGITYLCFQILFYQNWFLLDRNIKTQLFDISLKKTAKSILNTTKNNAMHLVSFVLGHPACFLKTDGNDII